MLTSLKHRQKTKEVMPLAEGLPRKALRASLLWPVLRPRDFHVFGVGMPKTGTHSLTGLFSNYRSAHEARGPETIRLIRMWTQGDLTEKGLRQALKRRDRSWRLECDVAHFLGILTPHLYPLFPDAKYILTVREPRSWLRSVVDQCINNSRERLLHLTPEKEWVSLRDIYFGSPPEEYPPEEEPLKENNLHSISGFLKYWTRHNRTVVDAIPSENLLVVNTSDISSSIDRIASFVGIPSDRLVTSAKHSYKASQRNGILDKVDEAYVQDKINRICDFSLLTKLTDC